MKVIIAGATGFIGSRVLQQAMLHPLITKIMVLTRRRLPDEMGSGKVRQILLQEHEWLEWAEETLRRLEGAVACIWCIGGRPGSFKDLETFDRVTHKYPFFAAAAFSSLPANEQGRFRFCYLSSWGADTSGTQFRPVARRHAYTKGKTEADLFELTTTAEPEKGWELYTFRPGTVVGVDGRWNKNAFDGVLGWVVPSVKVDLLAAAMIDVALNGYADDGLSVFFENRDIVQKGLEAKQDLKEITEYFKTEKDRKRWTAGSGNWHWTIRSTLSVR